jgi:hypothetical protein
MARTAASEPVRDVDVGRRERARLDLALRAAAVDPDGLDATRLDTNRDLLLTRLYRRPDDFAATAALTALNVFTAGQRTDARSDAPTRLQTAGLSSFQRLRRARPARAT